MLFGMGEFAPLQIPDLKATTAADERDLTLQLQLFAKIVGQEEASLFVGSAVLGLGMKLPQINAKIARRNSGNIFRRGADALELVRRHNEQKLRIWFGNHEELFARAISSPAGGNGDSMFVIELMTKFSGVKD
jgi:hypothetical protein